MMLDAWHDLRVDETGQALTVADALEAAWLIEHMLRPLARPGRGRHRALVDERAGRRWSGMAAKWRTAPRW